MHRHQYKGRKLGRKAGQRKALIRNLASQIILHEKVTTTLEKAKEVQPYLEKAITKARKGTLSDRRNVYKFISNNDLSVNKLFEQLGQLYKDRNGGYTRIIKLPNRLGDNARMAQIQLLDVEKLTKKEVEKSKKKATSVKEENQTKKASPKKSAGSKKITKTKKAASGEKK